MSSLGQGHSSVLVYLPGIPKVLDSITAKHICVCVVEVRGSRTQKCQLFETSLCMALGLACFVLRKPAQLSVTFSHISSGIFGLNDTAMILPQPTIHNN